MPRRPAVPFLMSPNNRRGLLPRRDDMGDPVKRLDMFGAMLLSGSGRQAGADGRGFSAAQRVGTVRNAGWTGRGLEGLRRQTGRFLAAVFYAGAASIGSPAAALTRDEAARVTDLLVALEPTLGRFAYGDDVARDWFAQDAEEGRVIQEAGFTAESWSRAVRETVQGFIASMSVDELDALHEDLRGGIKTLRELSESQTAAALKAVDEEYERLLVLRASGGAFAEAVRPIAPRIRALLLNAAQ